MSVLVRATSPCDQLRNQPIKNSSDCPRNLSPRLNTPGDLSVLLVPSFVPNLTVWVFKFVVTTVNLNWRLLSNGFCHLSSIFLQN